MRPEPILPLLFASILLPLLAGCRSETTSQGDDQDHALGRPSYAGLDKDARSGGPRKSPGRPSSSITAASLLAKQKIGQRLLGKTVKLVDGAFERVDLNYVPEHYLFYYCASW